MADFPSRTILKTLIAHLEAEMPSLVDAHDEFPNANKKLVMPCLTVFSQKPKYTPMMPYVIQKLAVIASGDDAGKVPVQKVMGAFEFKLQLDLWTTSKPARATLDSELMAAFSMNPSVHGLSLQLIDYYDQWARYDIVSFDTTDSEASSQRQEWRTKVEILASCKQIVQTNESVITTIENTLTTPVAIDADEDSSVTTII